MRSMLDTAMLEGDFLAILLYPITGLDEDRDKAVMIELRVRTMPVTKVYIDMIEPEDAAPTPVKYSYCEIMPGTYRVPIQTGSALIRLESRIKPGEMTQRWDAATEEDYEKAIGIFSERGIATIESRAAMHLQQELRELRLKRIGI